VPPSAELCPAPAPGRGRVFRGDARAGIADSAPDGRVRLDAVARWLQEIAYADVLDAGLAHTGVWVVRRTTVHVRRFPRLGAALELETFCSGLAKLWAERRTTLREAGEAVVEAVALWVHLRPDGGRPLPLGEDFAAVYGEAAGGRRVRARLRHPDPPPRAPESAWAFRAADLDLAGHVNNAVYWAVLEEALAPAAAPAALDAEIEYRAPAGAGPAAVVHGERRCWVRAPDGDVHASLRWR
jgi:acyl-ACP thioesterase